MSSSIDEQVLKNFHRDLLQRQHRNKWANVMDFDTYYDIMDYFRDYYRVYVVVTAIDSANEATYWNEVLLVSLAFYRQHYDYGNLLLSFDDFMNMTFFSMIAELEVRVLRKELERNTIDAKNEDKEEEEEEDDNDFREALFICAHLT